MPVNLLRPRILEQSPGSGLLAHVVSASVMVTAPPSFAPAYVGLANAHADLSTVFIGAPPAMERAKVESAARKALELDPELAEAHALLAAMQAAHWQWTEAEAEYIRAVKLDWSDAAAYNGLARWMIAHGRTEEALAWVRRGRELDPFAVSGTDVAWVLFQARRTQWGSCEACWQYNPMMP